MTVYVTKPAINLRETLADLDRDEGLVGLQLLSSGTATEAVEALNLEDHTFVTFNSTGIDDNATSTKLTVSDTGVDVNGDLKFNSGYGSVATAYGCRAWVNFNGTGVVSIRESGNVSSITDNGTGVYTLNFSTAMPDANYSVVTSGTMRGSSSAATAVLQIHNVSSGTPTTPQLMTTTAVRLGVKGTSSTAWDIPVGTVAILR